MSINGVWSSNGDDPSAGKGNLDVSNKQGGTGKFSEDKFEANHIDRRQFPIHTAPKSPAHQHLQGLRGQEHDPMRFRTGNLMSNIHDAGNKLGLKGGSPDVAHPGPGIRRKPVGSSREKPLPQPDDTTCAVS
ncbi:uncharacterized protein N7483_006200 [Penicillium malachiteum]|uniref:uncharacterized protein n=1 Tax=Penicillium malachiteum TaxID=1324776 RepID=UPI002546F16B|nr:uncharacterized protein N7483_006200 [Penicillium malachiteum]KAJ5731692.1 hypothetical protein N7483_006200 [Penicillium malachiteum]